ncbi:hypothetical protein D3C87_828700 [compost metagenome]
MLIRHSFFGIVRFKALYKLTIIWIAWNDGRFATFGIGQSFVSEQHTKTTLLFNTAMARNTFFIQDGLNLRIKIDFLFRRKK